MGVFQIEQKENLPAGDEVDGDVPDGKEHSPRHWGSQHYRSCIWNIN
jgi:hypothetical protein